MKRILLFLMMLTINIVGFAQSDETEKASPMTDTEIVRKCAILDVEGKWFFSNFSTKSHILYEGAIFLRKFNIKN